MIIEIALGIVLAVLILSVLPHILKLTVVVGTMALAVMIFAYVTFFILEKPEVLFVIPLSILASVILYFYDKSLRFRIYFWGAASFFGLLFTTYILYLFYDDGLRYYSIEALFFYIVPSFPIMMLGKTLQKEKKGSNDSSSSNN